MCSLTSQSRALPQVFANATAPCSRSAKASQSLCLAHDKNHTCGGAAAGRILRRREVARAPHFLSASGALRAQCGHLMTVHMARDVIWLLQQLCTDTPKAKGKVVVRSSCKCTQALPRNAELEQTLSNPAIPAVLLPQLLFPPLSQGWGSANGRGTATGTGGGDGAERGVRNGAAASIFAFFCKRPRRRPAAVAPASVLTSIMRLFLS